MIPRRYITEWKVNAPWPNDGQIEQDLVIERALYQRKKGRDLFDLFYALINANVDSGKVIEAYHQYMDFSVGQTPSKKEFIINMDQKMKDPDFIGDIYALLRPGTIYDQNEAYELIRSEIIDKM